MSPLEVAASLVRAVPDGPPEDAARLERDRMVLLHLIEHQRDVAVRAGRPGHLTGSAFVVDAAGTSCVLLKHRKLGRWLQPGGHADGETDLRRVALAEATEETGIDGLVLDPVPIDLDIHLVDPPDDEPHLHLDVRFLLRAPEGATVVANHESDDVRWVPVEDLDAFDPDASLVRLAAAARRRLASRS